MFWLVYTDCLGGRIGEKINGHDRAVKRFKRVSKDGVRESALYFDQSGFHSTTQLAFLILWHSPDGKCYWGNSMRGGLWNDRSEKEKKDIALKRFEVKI